MVCIVFCSHLLFDYQHGFYCILLWDGWNKIFFLAIALACGFDSFRNVVLNMITVTDVETSLLVGNHF